MIAPNTIVGGRYRVMRPLGGGGMKLVYLAEDLRLASRECALAEMVDTFPSPETQKQAVAAFQREADMLAQLSNEHIPRVFDRFSEQNHHYLVMEYVDGATLEEEMKHTGGRLAEPRVFGIARHFQPLQNATMIGTQGYAPPEQYRGKVELRSDLYALGATMHHALSGRDPANEAPFSFPPLGRLCSDVEPALARLVDDALAYDVEHRVPSAEEFKRRLEEIRDGVTPASVASTGGHADSDAA